MNEKGISRNNLIDYVSIHVHNSLCPGTVWPVSSNCRKLDFRGRMAVVDPNIGEQFSVGGYATQVTQKQNCESLDFLFYLCVFTISNYV